jgi:hypothetical protein
MVWQSRASSEELPFDPQFARTGMISFLKYNGGLQINSALLSVELHD